MFGLFFPYLFPGFLGFCSYITNLNSFPQPLSPEDEKKYLTLCWQGDLEARNILIEHNLRLVAHIVKKFSGTKQNQDDLISIGTIGLIKAISTYKENKKTRLSTYAAKCIENEILMHLRATKKIKSEVYLEDPIGTDKEGNEISLMDILGKEDDLVDDAVELKLYKKKLSENIMTALDPRERIVLQLRYGLKNGNIFTQREIAEKLGISRSYVSRIEKKAIDKLFHAIQPEH